MEIIASNKRGQKLLHEGFIYTVQHERPSGKRWQCVQRNEECKGAVKTTGITGDPRAGDTGEAGGAMAPPFFAKHRLFLC